MGRSVMTISDATATAYTTFGPDEEFYRERYDEEVSDGHLDPEEDDFEDWMYGEWNQVSHWDWDEYLEVLRDRVMELWPSFEEASEWIDQEINVIAKNAHSLVAVAEYGGVVAVMLAPNYDRDTFWRTDDPLGEKWRKSISEKFLTEFGDLRKIGTASNGEGFFERSN